MVFFPHGTLFHFIFIDSIYVVVEYTVPVPVIKGRKEKRSGCGCGGKSTIYRLRWIGFLSCRMDEDSVVLRFLFLNLLDFPENIFVS